MSNAANIEAVIRGGLCTGCGTCAAICPRDAVTMVNEERDGLYVAALDRDQCTECGLCLDVCPGHAVDFRRLNQDIFGREPEDAALGSFTRCYIGHAADHDLRYDAASGGLVTSLLIFALEAGMIDGALVTRMSQASPLEPQPFIARSREEIVAASKSKYCPVPANIALKEILKAGDGQRFAVVGLPCHIQGIRKAEAVIRKLRERITLHFGLVCSHSDSFHETEFLLRKQGIVKEDVAHIDYRGRGWPGCMTIRTRDGHEKAVRYDDCSALHAGYFFTPRRCTLCCDMGARLADITFMDAWLPEVQAADKTGTSIVISRTERGEDTCRKSIEESVVELKEIPCSEALRSQGRERMANRDLKAHFSLGRFYSSSRPRYAIEVPQSRPMNYLRVLVMHLDMWISSRKWLHGLIGPMISVQRHVLERGKTGV